MKKAYKIAAVVIVVVLIAGFCGYKYIMTGGKRDLSDEEAAYKTTVAALTAEFTADEAAASKKYLNKAINITGAVSASEKGTVTLGDKVICTLHDSLVTTPNAAQAVTVKGRVVGYDDLMEEIRLDECFIIQ